MDQNAKVESPGPARDLPLHEVITLKPRTANLALVVCVWNEGDRLAEQLERTRPYLDLVDVIISDRPSTDGSTRLERLEHAGISSYISLTRSSGLSASLRVALAHAMDQGYAGALMMDGNNKDDVDRLPAFVDAIRSGADFVQGSRYLRGAEAVRTPWIREVLIRRVHVPLFSLMSGYRFTDTTNGFRAFSRSFLLDARAGAFRHAFNEYELPYYLAWSACRRGFRVREIPASRVYPVGPAPTKIRGLSRHWQMLKPLVMLLLRRY